MFAYTEPWYRVGSVKAPVACRAGKAATELAAWTWAKENPNVRFNLAGLNSGMAFGAFVPGAEPKSLERLNTSNRIVWRIVSAGQNNGVPPSRGPVWSEG
ncbi:hypothetical protein F4779DRAFT_617756 [Xylariaceae sp. FL0662B]|nr:hypothetical protein F4779DRAFT_617756 [Xylariaceae sp. FL0662B]